MQKVRKTPSQPISWGWWRILVIPATQETEVGGLQSKVAWAKTQDPVQKTTKTKRAGGVAQMVEHLPSNRVPLSLNPSTVKTKQKTLGC
jgi:hypothetical protein